MFSTKSLTIHIGDSVLVSDKDAIAPHTFNIDKLGIDSGQMSNGDTRRYTFGVAGTFTFYCVNHNASGMNGTLTVTA